MDLGSKKAALATPAKTPKANRSKTHGEISKNSENLNPNLRSPCLKSSKSPAIKSVSKTQTSISKNPNPNPVVVLSPGQKIRQRKFVVVGKRNSKKEKTSNTEIPCKCKDKVSEKCLCAAFESLRASQEEFFKNRADKPSIEDEEERGSDGIDEFMANEVNGGNPDETEPSIELGNLHMKRNRGRLLEEARQSIPEPGSGKVMNLVKAFEGLLKIPKSDDLDQNSGGDSEVLKWESPETQVSPSSFCPSDFFVTSESLGLDSRLSTSSNGSISSRNSGGGRKSRRNSAESASTFGGSRWKKKQQLKVTSLKPFKLRTEERGSQKQEEFIKKVHQMMTEEQKQRIPIAQGLPWTTDERERLVKPPVKEITWPVDLVLHSDVRAVERSEFDQQISEKMTLIEEYRMEKERQQKLEEEEEIKRLRKELVPKAQPMPYFDRPFIPKRSEKHPTIPKEPRFHLPQHKKIKCSSSWNDDMFSVYQENCSVNGEQEI